MNMSPRNHTVLAAMISAVLATSMIAPASARQPTGAQPDQRHENQSDDKKKANEHKDDKADKHKKENADQQTSRNHAGDRNNSHESAQRNSDAKQQAHRADQQRDHNAERRQDKRQDRATKRRQEHVQDARRDRPQADHHRISERDQRSRIQQQSLRVQANVQYQSRSRKLEHERAKQLKRENRNAQYLYQQAYYQRLIAQQSRLNAQRYNYNSNPFFNSPDSYRYSYGGRNYTTNQYGADLLRQAVNYGYQEGLRAGHADRSDRWQSDYRTSYAYQDASYGYNNYYVDREEYNYYFRQGFQRGYNDGYGSRNQYGNYSSNYLGGYNNNGTASILQTVLATILNLQQMNR